MRFNVNYTETNAYQLAFLPPRVLKESDHIPFVFDFSLEENFGIVGVEGVYQLNQTSSGVLQRMFENVTCSAVGRQAARDLLHSSSASDVIVR